MSKKITVRVSLLGLAAGLVGMVGAGLIVAVALGRVPRELAWLGHLCVVGAAVAIIDMRIESTVERVVCREVGDLLEREIAAYHLGRSRTDAEA